MANSHAVELEYRAQDAIWKEDKMGGGGGGGGERGTCTGTA